MVVLIHRREAEMKRVLVGAVLLAFFAPVGARAEVREVRLEIFGMD